MKLRQLLREPRFASTIEREYALSFIRIYERNNCFVWLGLNVTFWALFLLATVFVPISPSATTILAIALGVMAVYSLAMWTQNRKALVFRRMQLVGYLVCHGFCFAAALAEAGAGAGEPSRAVAVFWITGGLFGVGFLAYRNWVHTAVIIVTAVAYFVGLRDFPEPYIGFFVALSLMLFASNIQVFLHRLFKLEAIRSFRDQAMFTPKQVLLKAIEETKPVSEVFPPQNRFCVCVCSDWRAFQDFAGSHKPKEVADALAAYYAGALARMESAFPHGNYFFDWIADELFLVAFETPHQSHRELLDGAVTFAKAVLAVRPAFAQKFGAPVGIDVGISFGEATIGILGPEGSVKATALGAVPGQARRLQALGKSLRSRRGDLDRIVISGEAATYLDTVALRLERTTVESWMQARNLDDSHVYIFHSAIAQVDQGQPPGPARLGGLAA